MAWTWIITKLDDEGEFLKAFGQILFSGNYVQGGDAVGTIVLDKGTAGVSGVSTNSAGIPVFLSGQTSIHATRSPFSWNIQVESGYNPVFIPGSTALNFKIKFWDPSTKAELGAGAYPAALTGAVFNTLEVAFKRNI